MEIYSTFCEWLFSNNVYSSSQIYARIQARCYSIFNYDNKILETIHLVESFPELPSLQDKDRCDVACAQK